MKTKKKKHYTHINPNYKSRKRTWATDRALFLLRGLSGHKFSPYMELREILQEKGLALNVPINALGETPLHIVSRSKFTELVLLFISFGADPYIKNTQGNTPIDYLKTRKHPAKDLCLKDIGSFYLRSKLKMNAEKLRKESALEPNHLDSIVEDINVLSSNVDLAFSNYIKCLTSLDSLSEPLASMLKATYLNELLKVTMDDNRVYTSLIRAYATKPQQVSKRRS